MSTIEVGTKIKMMDPRERNPDEHVQAGWTGVVTTHEVVTKAEETASEYELLEGENIYTVRWDNGYSSFVSPENGDHFEPCGVL